MRPLAPVCLQSAAIVTPCIILLLFIYHRGADKSLARPGRKQPRKHVSDARYCNSIETRAVIKFFFVLQGKAPKEIHAILTEKLDCFLHDRAQDLSAPLFSSHSVHLPFFPVQCSHLHPTLHLHFV